MDDLISRQAAIAALCDEYCGGWQDCKHYPKCENLKAIQNLPPAHPEIIRCKDCKWYGRADKRRFYRGMDCLQKRIDTIVTDKDFCSRAERREE